MQPASQKFVAALQPGFVFLLLWGAASHAPMAMAQSPGTFTATGDMTTPHVVFPVDSAFPPSNSVPSRVLAAPT